MRASRLPNECDALLDEVVKQVRDVLDDGLGIAGRIIVGTDAGQRGEGVRSGGDKRDVIVDAEDADGRAVLITDENRARTQDAAVVRLGEVGEAVIELVKATRLDGLEDDVAGTGANGATGDVTVLDS